MQDDIANLSKKLDAVALQTERASQQPGPPRPGPVPRAGRSTSTTAAAVRSKPPATAAAATSPSAHQQGPPIVRRSRRGDRAIAHHAQIGTYRVELTSSERLWCGKFALGISTAQQLGGAALTVEEFDEIFAGAESRAFNARHGWGGGGGGVEGTAANFYDEQLDFVLRVWGRRRGWRLQLGMVRDFEGVFVNRAPEGQGEEEEEEERGEWVTVWIHNDNAMLLGKPYNHYSGISVLEKAR